MSEAPNKQAILAYAASKGVQNARLVNEGVFGWILYGDGKGRTWPLVWSVADSCGIGSGCGGGTVKGGCWKQVRPQNFKLPSAVSA
jgi:hypothetical protein